MRLSTRRRGHLGLLALLLALPAGCGDPRANAGAPVDAGHCNDLPYVGGDPGVLVGTHWSSDEHPWGATTTVYACNSPGMQGWLSMSASGHGIRVAPDEVRLESEDSGIYAFQVTVEEGALGALQIDVHGGGRFRAGAPGPRVEEDGDGWRFAEQD